MTTLDWSKCSGVEISSDKPNYTWVFHGTRIPVITVFENLGKMGVEELIERFGVTREQIDSVLKFVVQSLGLGPLPELPAWNLGAVGSLRRRELYDRE